MGLIWTVIVGLIVGVLARFILPGKEAFPEGALGVLLTAILGIAGAFVGTFIGRMLGFSGGDGDGVYAAGIIMSIIGAILLLLLVRLIMGRGNTARV